MKYICLHHSGLSRAKQKYQFLPIDRYHKEKWNMISQLGFYGGYNYLIEPTGYVVQYRRIGEETMAVTGHNSDSIHIALTGNFSEEMPTKEQIDALRDFLKKLTKEYNIPIENILPHRKLQPGTNCNGVLLSDDWGQRLLNYHEAVFTVPQQELNDMAKKLDYLRGVLLNLQAILRKLLNR